jgi:hypothetical protein
MMKLLMLFLHVSMKLLIRFAGVLGSLRQLSTNTSILSNPGKLPEEAARAVTKIEPSGDMPVAQTHYRSRSGTLSHQSSSSSCSSMS